MSLVKKCHCGLTTNFLGWKPGHNGTECALEKRQRLAAENSSIEPARVTTSHTRDVTITHNRYNQYSSPVYDNSGSSFIEGAALGFVGEELLEDHHQNQAIPVAEPYTPEVRASEAPQTYESAPSNDTNFGGTSNNWDDSSNGSGWSDSSPSSSSSSNDSEFDGGSSSNYDSSSSSSSYDSGSSSGGFDSGASDSGAGGW